MLWAIETQHHTETLMILEIGMKVLVAHRRLFEHDQARLFFGTVEGYDAGIARITGYTWLRDGFRGGFRRKDDLRTKIVAIASGSVIVYQLEASLDLEALEIKVEGDRVVARDGHEFLMDLSEGAPVNPGAPLARR